MAVVNESMFSQSLQFLAHSSPDGSLKVWNTVSGILEQQFTPSSHLSATCTCISWGSLPSKLNKTTKKKKKKKLSHVSDQDAQNFIAMGTMSGSVLVYNVAKADLETQLDNGHTNRVNDVGWDRETNNAFSCSSDGYIVQWSLEEGKVISKWKNEDGSSVHSIAVMNNNNLLSASRTILWWDIASKKVLKKFTGHATEVNRLIPIYFPDGESEKDSYFLSSAVNDRNINAWKLKRDDSRTPVGMLSVNEEVVNVDVSNVTSKSEPVFIFVVTKSGILRIFEHQLNGKCKKPLKSKINLQIASETENGIHSVPIPILNARFISHKEFLIVHGNFLKPTFERLRFDECTNNTCLVRKHHALSSIGITVSNTKIKVPDVKSNSKIVGPAHMNPGQPQEVQISDAMSRKRKNELKTSELAIGIRLNDSRNKKNSVGGEASGDMVPQTDNMVHLLTQGLQSGDIKMLNSVLEKSGETEIRNTVRKLPLQYIMPLLKELTKRMHGKSQSNHPYIKWVTSVLITHTSYFTVNSEAVELLKPLNELLNSKLDMFHRVSRLSGRLDLILSQVASRQEDHSDIPTEPLLFYQEDSPEEDDDDDMMRPVHSESEDNWDDLSDLENMNKLDDEDIDSSAEGSDLSEDDIDMT